MLSKAAFTAAQLTLLRGETERLGFGVLVDPDVEPESECCAAWVGEDLAELDGRRDGLARSHGADRQSAVLLQPAAFPRYSRHDREAAAAELLDGVLRGNLTASITLVLILAIALVAVVCTILLPLRVAAAGATPDSSLRAPPTSR